MFQLPKAPVLEYMFVCSTTVRDSMQLARFPRRLNDVIRKNTVILGILPIG